MRRTKEWWGNLDQWERKKLVALERAEKENYAGSPYLPDDCTECSCCSMPHIGGGGLCPNCLSTLIALIAKGDSGAEGGGHG